MIFCPVQRYRHIIFKHKQSKHMSTTRNHIIVFRNAKDDEESVLNIYKKNSKASGLQMIFWPVHQTFILMCMSFLSTFWACERTALIISLSLFIPYNIHWKCVTPKRRKNTCKYVCTSVFIVYSFSRFFFAFQFNIFIFPRPKCAFGNLTFIRLFKIKHCTVNRKKELKIIVFLFS